MSHPTVALTTPKIRLKEKYLRRLANYTHWCSNDFLRPKEVPLSETGASPEEAMFLWETHGREAVTCTDPHLLATYMEGKTARDFHIKEWKLGCEQRLFVPEEFFGSLGLRSAKEF